MITSSLEGAIILGEKYIWLLKSQETPVESDRLPIMFYLVLLSGMS